jgi:RND family efflux transporter MFP subunit
METEKADLSSLKINRAKPEFDQEDSRNGRGKMFIIIVILGAVIAGGYFLVPNFRSAKPITVTTVSMTSASAASGILTASGYIVPQRKASVASKGTGRLVFLGVEEGDRVKTGQIIARLESTDVEAQLDQAKANLSVAKAQLQQSEADLEKAQNDYTRNEAFLKSKVITDQEFDVFKSQYRSAQARLASAKANILSIEALIRGAEIQIENTIIRAPFDATVLTKNADVGEIVAPFAAGANSRGNVVTLADMSSLQLEADVSESNIERVKINQPCEITLDAFPEKRYRGVVWKIVPTADRAKATIMTKVKFIDIDNKVLPEMSAKVTFLSETVTDSAMQAKPKMMVPGSAVVERDGKKVLWVVKDDRVTETVVLTGNKFGDRIEILGGAKAGDKIVLSPTDDLRNGDKVTTDKK